MSNFFVSTAGAGNNSALDYGKALIERGFTGLELSGGIYDPHWRRKIDSLLGDCKLVLHNYFPIPRDSFVINLASKNINILNKSIEFIRNSIDISSQIGAKWYGVHAGFLYDPKPFELGKRLNSNVLLEYEAAHSIFINSLKKLGEYSESKGIRLLVENHVLTRENYQIFDEVNPLMMVDVEGILNVMNDLDNRVGLLVDLGHLNVSSKTLGFDPKTALKELDLVIEGYQLSENDGVSDLHEMFGINSWFTNSLNPLVEYVSFEVKNPILEDLDNFIYLWKNSKNFRGLI